MDLRVQLTRVDPVQPWPHFLYAPSKSTGISADALSWRKPENTQELRAGLQAPTVNLCEPRPLALILFKPFTSKFRSSQMFQLPVGEMLLVLGFGSSDTILCTKKAHCVNVEPARQFPKNNQFPAGKGSRTQQRKENRELHSTPASPSVKDSSGTPTQGCFGYAAGLVGVQVR